MTYVYRGHREHEAAGPAEVTVSEGSDGNRVPLDPRNDLFNHSPDGFLWGYSGSGPAQLALAILAHHFRSRLKSPNSATRATADERAVKLHQRFKAAAIAPIDGDDFMLTTEQIEAHLDGIDRRGPRAA